MTKQGQKNSQKKVGKNRMQQEYKATHIASAHDASRINSKTCKTIAYTTNFEPCASSRDDINCSCSRPEEKLKERYETAGVVRRSHLCNTN